MLSVRVGLYKSIRFLSVMIVMKITLARCLKFLFTYFKKVSPVFIYLFCQMQCAALQH